MRERPDEEEQGFDKLSPNGVGGFWVRPVKNVAILISGRGSNMQALVEQARGYRVVLVASVKNADGARCGFLQPVPRSRAHAQTDPDRQKVRRQRAGERNLAIDQAAAEEHMVTVRKSETAGQRGARHLCGFETGAVDRIPQILKRGNWNTSPPSRGQK